MEYELVVGMEVHAELNTESKIFCGCSNAFGGEPNTQTCPVCLGLPGSLPVLNHDAVRKALQAAMALHCRIDPRTEFERKNYYYPDLPKNYQISQHRKNLGDDGYLDITVDGETKRVRIHNIHMEEDAGKNVHSSHAWDDTSGVDLNRTGAPLIEIVTEPDMRSSDDAVAFMKKLKSVLEYLEVSDCNMHEGRLRFEANVSVRPVGSDTLGNKVELKNINSLKFIQKGIEYERRRQISLLDAGERVRQETRLWDPQAGETRTMRSKEESHDYRYFPEPDLPPVVFDDAWLDAARASLPEMPEKRQARFVEDYDLPDYDAGVLTESKKVADFFEEALTAYANPKAMSNWIMTELLRVSGEGEEEDADFPVAPKDLAELVKMVDEDTISGRMAKAVFKKMVETGDSPQSIVEAEGMAQVSDAGELEGIIAQIVADNPQAVEDYKAGKQKSIGFLIGQIMKATRGQANPQIANELLRKALDQA